MGEDFKPSLQMLAVKKFDGKIKADYDELTQFLSLGLAKDGKASTYKGVVDNQAKVDEVVNLLLQVVDYVEVVEDNPEKTKK